MPFKLCHEDGPCKGDDTNSQFKSLPDNENSFLQGLQCTANLWKSIDGMGKEIDYNFSKDQYKIEIW